jgi:hypothetical protein
MPVKSRKEPEAVLARKIRAAANARTRNRQAASLPAEDPFRFVNGNLKSAFDQLVRGAQACNASTQYRHSNGHVDYVTTAVRRENFRQCTSLEWLPIFVRTVFAITAPTRWIVGLLAQVRHE